MAVKLRLMRMGKKKQPTYRVVAADARSPRNGRFIEIVGTYDPRPDPSAIGIDNDKAVDWLRKGAQPTESVRKLLEDLGRLGRRSAASVTPGPTRRRTAGRRAASASDRRCPRRSRCPPQGPCSSTWSSALVDDPDAVRIDLSEGRSLPRLTVRVGPTDMGRVIGKRGRVAQAIRTVVRAAAVRDGIDVEVEFVD